MVKTFYSTHWSGMLCCDFFYHTILWTCVFPIVLFGFLAFTRIDVLKVALLCCLWKHSCRSSYSFMVYELWEWNNKETNLTMDCFMHYNHLIVCWNQSRFFFLRLSYIITIQLSRRITCNHVLAHWICNLIAWCNFRWSWWNQWSCFKISSQALWSKVDCLD